LVNQRRHRQPAASSPNRRHRGGRLVGSASFIGCCFGAVSSARAAVRVRQREPRRSRSPAAGGGGQSGRGGRPASDPASFVLVPPLWAPALGGVSSPGVMFGVLDARGSPVTARKRFNDPSRFPTPRFLLGVSRLAPDRSGERCTRIAWLRNERPAVGWFFRSPARCRAACCLALRGTHRLGGAGLVKLVTQRQNAAVVASVETERQPVPAAARLIVPGGSAASGR